MKMYRGFYCLALIVLIQIQQIRYSSINFLITHEINFTNQKILYQLLSRALRKRYIPKEKKPKEPEATAFTEEDFKKFEKEYVDQ